MRELRYEIEGFTLVKPNYAKEGSEHWSKDWLGYLTPRGTRYDDDSEIKFDRMQFSLVLSNGKVIARRRSKPSEYNHTNHPLSDSVEFSKVINALVDKLDIGRLLESQIPLVRSYVRKVIVT